MQGEKKLNMWVPPLSNSILLTCDASLQAHQATIWCVEDATSC